VALSAATPSTKTTRKPAWAPNSKMVRQAIGSRMSPGGPNSRSFARSALWGHASTNGVSTARTTAMIASRHTPALPAPPNPATNEPFSDSPANPSWLAACRLAAPAMPA
jgi:hypothetical protein